MNFKKMALAVVCAGGAMAATVPAQAANWLMLQGTERDSAAGRAKVWGFIQPEAQYVKGTTVQAGAWKGSPMQANTLAPDRSSTATMNIRRARIGVRGQGFPLDGKTNYFILGEFGHNGITAPGPNRHGAVYLTDASVTLNHVPGARFRVGQFKTPGSEEGLQAIHVFDYINFTNVTDQLLLERYFAHDGSGTYVKSATDNANVGGANPPITGVGAFRDIGAQLFDTFKFGAWEASYAAMIGNGNGINAQDNNNAKDYYGYVSVEQVYGGKGPRIQSWKTFGWVHLGTRTLADGEHDRNRYGVGTTFRKGKFRAAAEYIMADGMIRNGTDGGAKPGSQSSDATGNTVASVNIETDGEANGYYAHLGYQVIKRVELDLRYDVLNRVTNNSTKERKFSTITFGAQYFINKKTRIVANYEMRSLEAPGLASDHNANKIGEGIDDRMSLQLLAIF